jgi:hypothetical protein
MSMDYTYNEYAHVLNPRYLLIAEQVLMHGNTYYSYVILVDVMQMLMCFDDWSSVSVRKEA